MIEVSTRNIFETEYLQSVKVEPIPGLILIDFVPVNEAGEIEEDVCVCHPEHSRFCNMFDGA